MLLNKDFKYIDLFAGIGGFHSAMQKYSDKAICIMASEINKEASKVYFDNYKLEPLGDIKNVKGDSLDDFEVLCAGFPCQAFSKAGSQNGFGDPRGTLFYEIIRILKDKPRNHRPKILILENVKNLITHDSGRTWKTIKHSIIECGYNIVDKPIVIGPKDLGIPQIRDRAIILAVRKDIYSKPIDIEFIQKKTNSTSIYTIVNNKISKREKEKYSLDNNQIEVLECWDDFYKGITEKVLGFPVWSDEFGETYNISKFPKWKQEIIEKNRILYKNNQNFIDAWLEKWNIRNKFTKTNRKFEWQAGLDIRSVFEGIIQFRPSGVRIKRPTESPTLVAMNHRPIIGKYRRYITLKEATKLQCFPENFIFNESENHAYKQLGNAVNVDVIEYAFANFIKYLEKRIENNYAKKDRCKY